MIIGKCNWCHALYGESKIGTKCDAVYRIEDAGGPDDFNGCGGTVETYEIPA